MRKLDNKVAVVTGATLGMGLAAARLLATQAPMFTSLAAVRTGSTRRSGTSRLPRPAG